MCCMLSSHFSHTALCVDIFGNYIWMSRHWWIKLHSYIKEWECWLHKSIIGDNNCVKFLLTCTKFGESLPKMSVISRNLLLSIDLFLYLTVIVFTIYYILNVLIILLHWRWLERFSPENVLFTSTNIPADSVMIRKIAIYDLKRKKATKSWFSEKEIENVYIGYIINQKYWCFNRDMCMKI